MNYLLTAALLLGTNAMGEDKKDGFVPLFDGKTLDGWEIKEPKNPPKDVWTVKEGGILACKAGGGWIGTKEQYGDFVLKLEWKIPENGNSGVFLRVPGIKEGVSPSETGFEIQVLDDTGPQYKDKLKPYQYSGGLYHFVGPSKKVYKPGEWNSYEITCKGDTITVVYNGEKVIEFDGSKDASFQKREKKGFIGLQNHGSGVEYRNIMIKALDKERVK